MPLLDFMFCVKGYIFLYILPQRALLLTVTLCCGIWKCLLMILVLLHLVLMMVFTCSCYMFRRSEDSDSHGRNDHKGRKSGGWRHGWSARFIRSVVVVLCQFVFIQLSWKKSGFFESWFFEFVNLKFLLFRWDHWIIWHFFLFSCNIERMIYQFHKFMQLA